MKTEKIDSEKNRSEELAALVSLVTPGDGLFETDCPGLVVSRISTPLPRQPVPYKASLCVVVQGQKQLFLGDRTYTYDPFHYLVVPMVLPLEMKVTRCTKDKPVLGLGLEIDSTILSELLLAVDSPKQFPEADDSPAIFVSKTSWALRDGLIRLMKLLANPTDLKILGPSIIREIIYRILQGEQGGRLQNLVLRDSGSHRIISIIRYLNENYSDKLNIEDISHLAGMSTSAFHHKFKEVTSMSPIQYLKKIRLHYARTMMLDQGLNAGEAGFQVGYTNPSQFSREFKRMFGLPPIQLLKTISTTD